MAKVPFYRVTVEIDADNVLAAWNALRHIPEDFTPPALTLAKDSGFISFEIIEVARSFDVDLIDSEGETK